MRKYVITEVPIHYYVTGLWEKFGQGTLETYTASIWTAIVGAGSRTLSPASTASTDAHVERMQTVIITDPATAGSIPSSVGYSVSIAFIRSDLRLAKYVMILAYLSGFIHAGRSEPNSERKDWS